MRAKPVLGLVGGLGVGATIHYYRAITTEMTARGLATSLCMVHAESSVVTGLALAGEKERLADYLAPFVASLARAGATFAALPALTPHFAFEELSVRATIPLLDARTGVRADMRSRGSKRVAVFGTRPTIESRIFGALAPDETVAMAESDITTVHDIYYAIVKSGACAPAQREYLRGLARRLIERAGADAIAFAGTDLSLAFAPGDAGFPIIDCAALQIDDIVRVLAGETPAPAK